MCVKGVRHRAATAPRHVEIAQGWGEEAEHELMHEEAERELMHEGVMYELMYEVMYEVAVVQHVHAVLHVCLMHVHPRLGCEGACPAVGGQLWVQVWHGAEGVYMEGREKVQEDVQRDGQDVMAPSWR